MRQLVVLAMLAAAIGAGCGYNGQGLHPKDVKTVAVPTWTRGKNVYRRDWEQTLTKAIINRLETSTSYKVTTKDRADTLLTGTLDEIPQRTLSRNSGSGVPREYQLTFVVSYKWEDLRSGKVRVERKSFPVAVTYIPPDPYNEDFFLGSQELVDKLAMRIVETMESEW